MEPTKKTCDICTRLYKIAPLKYPAFVPRTSNVRINICDNDKISIFDYDVCPNCAAELNWRIKTMRRNATRKCFFCEFDRGPLYEDPQPECRACVKFSNFQKKKRMSNLMKHQWDFFNGDLDDISKGE